MRPHPPGLVRLQKDRRPAISRVPTWTRTWLLFFSLAGLSEVMEVRVQEVEFTRLSGVAAMSPG